jgi:hypothetical protein
MPSRFSPSDDNTSPHWLSMLLSISLFSSRDIDAVVDANHFGSVHLREMTVYHMVEAQKPTPAHAINLAFADALLEAKRMPLLAILTRTDFEDLSHFRDQVAYLQEALNEYPRTSSATVILPEPFHANLVRLNSRSVDYILMFDQTDARGC